MKFETRLNIFEREIVKLNKRIVRLRRTCAHAITRCASMEANQTHYLRHRAPAVMRRQGRIVEKAQLFLKKLDSVPGKKWHSTSKAENAGPKCARHMLMVTNNQARKLKALADTDLRSILNTKANRDSGKRVSLSVYGQKHYKTVAE